MFRDLPKYAETTSNSFWSTRTPAHWAVHPGLAVLQETRHKNTGLIETQVLSLSYGQVVVKPLEKQRGLVPDSYEGYQILEPGDIVVRPTDLQNDQTSVRVGHVKDRGIITSAYIGLRPSGEWNGAYAYQYLRVLDSTKRIYGMGSGLRQQLGWADLKRMPCLVPSIEEQSAIAKYLAHANARIDKAIAAKHQLIRFLKEQMVSARDDVLRQIAERNPARRLKTLLQRIDQGISPQAESQIPKSNEWGVLKSGCVNGGTFRRDQIKRLPDGFDAPVELGIANGDILVSRASGSPDLVGSTARVSGFQGQAILSDKTFRLVVRPDVSADYLVMMMNSTFYRRQVRMAISGAEGLASNLPVSALRTFEFPVPPLEEQGRIVEEVALSSKGTLKTIDRVEREIILLQEFRTRLVADVVTGQVDVRAIAASLPDAPEQDTDLASLLEDDLEDVLSEGEE